MRLALAILAVLVGLEFGMGFAGAEAEGPAYSYDGPARVVATAHVLVDAITTPATPPRTDGIGPRPVPRGSAGTVRVVSGLVLAAKAPARAARGGESPAAAYGRRIHREFDYGPGYVKEFRGLPSGRRPDAVNFADRVVAELKPNNPTAIRRGQRQLDVYRRELEQEFGGTWRTRLETYDRPAP